MSTMKTLFCFLLSAFCFAAVAQYPPPPAPATQAQVNAGTSTRTYVSPATLASSGLSNGVARVNTVILGSGANTVTIGVTNGAPTANGSYWMTWTEYLDSNTNRVLMTNNPTTPAFNQAYYWFSPGCLTNAANARNLTNRMDFSATNVLGAGVTNYWATATPIGGSSVQVSTSLVNGTWVSAAAGTNTFASTWYETNAIYKWPGFTSATNYNQLLADLTNGAGTQVYSNGAAYQITSRIGATNKSWLLILAAP